VTDQPSSSTRRQWSQRLPTVIEILLAVVLAFSLGRLTDHHSFGPQPGAVDVGFSQDMAVHHEQAVLMANLAQSRAGRAVLAVADGILISQSEEIGLMRGWLRLWHRPAADPHPMSWMSMPPSGTALASGTTMPGMASAGQLTRLASLTGRRFDVLFLQLMIRHHEGGIKMCRYAQTHASLGLVRNAATSMAVEQIQDLGQLRALLQTEGGIAGGRTGHQ
jgi:uncharacterized protein (DUF305 family)